MREIEGMVRRQKGRRAKEEILHCAEITKARGTFLPLGRASIAEIEPLQYDFVWTKPAQNLNQRHYEAYTQTLILNRLHKLQVMHDAISTFLLNVKAILMNKVIGER